MPRFPDGLRLVACLALSVCLPLWTPISAAQAACLQGTALDLADCDAPGRDKPGNLVPFIAFSALDRKAYVTMGSTLLYESAPVVRMTESNGDMRAWQKQDNRAVMVGVKWKF